MPAPLEKITKILKLLHIKNAFKVAIQLTSGNMNYYDNLLNIKDHMIGGAKKCTEPLNYKGIDFMFYCYPNKHSILYAIHPENNLDHYCSIIIIDSTEKCASINGINYDPSCFTGVQVGSFGDKSTGSLLLRVGLQLINKLKSKYDLKYVHLTDNSQKSCASVKKMIDLDSLCMLTSGDTWYGKYGFIPFDSTNITTNTDMYDIYKKNQNIVRTTLLKNTHIKEIIINAINKYKIKLDIVEASTVIDQYIKKNKTVAKYLRDLTQYYDIWCLLFYYVYRDIMKDIGVITLHNTKYWKEL
jgi:hypothetical protein